MGRIYARGGVLWLDFVDLDGERRRRSSGLPVGHEDAARKKLEDVEARVAAHEAAGGGHLGPVTVAIYVARWLKERLERRALAAKDETGIARCWIIPTLGEIVLTDLRPRQVRDFVRKLCESKSERGTLLAPKTVRWIYGLLKRMLEDAKADELISANPRAVRSGELPAKVDADPTWRRGAVFSAAEAEALFSDERIPEDRRTLNALLFLSGVRFGEASALRWRDHEPKVEPLGRLHVATSFNTQHHVVKATKTNRARTVPVHPTLAKVLATWKLGGWSRMLGRVPTADDLIIPSREGRHRNVNLGLKRFHEDLETVSLRRRRQHDARRTSMSLALAAGARKDVLRWVTHGGALDVMDMYTTLPWPALCEAVACLPLEIREGKVIALPVAESTPAEAEKGGRGPARQRHSATPETKNPEGSGPSGLSVRRGGRDLNPRPPA